MKYAKFRLLDKISNKLTDKTISVNNSDEIETLSVEVYACFTEPPTEISEDYVLVGSEDAIVEQLSQYKAAGVTDCGIQISPSQDRDRAMKLISTLPKFFA